MKNQGKIDEPVKRYDKLDSELGSEISLKKIWVVIEEWDSFLGK